MARTVADRLAHVHPKMLAAPALASEGDRKPVAEQEWKRRIGLLILRALALAELTPQEVSFAMGYRDQSAVSRWIAAVERPIFDKLFAVDRFYDAWVIACAEHNPRLEVVTQISIKRKVAA